MLSSHIDRRIPMQLIDCTDQLRKHDQGNTPNRSDQFIGRLVNKYRKGESDPSLPSALEQIGRNVQSADPKLRPQENELRTLQRRHFVAKVVIVLAINGDVEQASKLWKLCAFGDQQLPRFSPGTAVAAAEL